MSESGKREHGYSKEDLDAMRSNPLYQKFRSREEQDRLTSEAREAYKGAQAEYYKIIARGNRTEEQKEEAKMVEKRFRKAAKHYKHGNFLTRPPTDAELDEHLSALDTNERRGERPPRYDHGPSTPKDPKEVSSTPKENSEKRDMAQRRLQKAANQHRRTASDVIPSRRKRK